MIDIVRDWLLSLGPEMRLLTSLAGVGAAVAVIWNLARWLRGRGTQQIAARVLTGQTVTEARLGTLEMQVHDLPDEIVQRIEAALLARIEARLAAFDVSGGSPMDRQPNATPFMADLKAAIQRVAATGDKAALHTLMTGDTTGASALLARMQTKQVAGAEDEAAAAREQGALALAANPDEAMRYYHAATELDPGNAQGWMALAELHRCAGNMASAEQCSMMSRQSKPAS
jgi:hypothetical protein